MRQRTAKASKDGRTVVQNSAKQGNEDSANVIKNILITLICFVFLLCFFKWVSTPNVRRSQATKDSTNGMNLVNNILGERGSPLGEDFLSRTRSGRRQAQNGRSKKEKRDPEEAPFRKDREKSQQKMKKKKEKRRVPQNEDRELMRGVREEKMQEHLQHREKTDRKIKEKVQTRVQQGRQDIEDVYLKTKRDQRQEKRRDRVLQRSKGRGTNGRLGPLLLGDDRADKGFPSANNREKGNLIDKKRDNIFNNWVAANYDERIIESVKTDASLRDDLKQKFNSVRAGKDSPPRGDSLRKQAVRQQADAATMGSIRGDSPRKRAILNQD